MKPWTVLIVDDKPDLHALAESALGDVLFDNRPIECLRAGSSGETRRIMADRSDIALVLMDAVLETDDAGLELSRCIRGELKNHLTQIILLTDGTGEAPERRTVVESDINDYRDKVSLGANRLVTSVVKSLRSYRDITQIDRMNQELQDLRDGLNAVIESSSKLFESRSIEAFLNQLLRQTERMVPDGERLIATDGRLTGILASAGEWRGSEGKDPAELVGEDALAAARRLPPGQAGRLDTDNIALRFSSPKDDGIVMIAGGCRRDREAEWKRLDLFFANAAIVYTNLSLEADAAAAQNEMIGLLVNVAENRSKVFRGSINRVSDFAAVIAEKLGFSPEEKTLLRDAALMHDIGKVGVFDSILLKPGSLTAEEFEQMKQHTVVGYEILRRNPRKLFQTAAVIAHEHHEHWDGSGYPRGLSGESIHEWGRIVGIADVADALSRDRVDGGAWEFDDIIRFLQKGRGSRYDPRLLDLFLEDLDRIKEITVRYAD